MEQTKTLEAKVGCRAVMKGNFRFCSEKPAERTCACQGPSMIGYVPGKPAKLFASTYICVDRKYK